MKTAMRLSRNLWSVPVLILGAVLVSGCAAAPEGSEPVTATWSGVPDCFERAVAVPATGAGTMATLCGGKSAAGDPARSGIERANAYYNAAAAYNAVTLSGQQTGLCETSGACHQMALAFLDNSLANQRDDQIGSGASAAEKRLHSQFVLRRQLERAIALQGLAAESAGAASCGSRNACLSEAARTLRAFDPATGFKPDDPVSNALACRVLDVRWRVNFALGRDFEHQYVEDLRQVATSCPALSASARDQLAEIAFNRAERARLSLSEEGALPSLDRALGAITDYTAAAKVKRFELEAQRGMGEAYYRLSQVQPGAAETYLDNAITSYKRVLELGEGTQPAEMRAIDFEQLGTSLAARARLTGLPGSEEKRAAYARAAEAYGQAIAMAPTAGRYVMLGEAAGASGQYQASVAAYRSALSGLSGAEKTQASLALVAILDRMGDESGALALLKQVSGEASGTPQVEYEIGLREFLDGGLAAALAKLAPIAERLPAAEAAEAHYMISAAEMSLRRPGWPDRALAHADRAVALNAGKWAYSRQNCLAHIVVGGRAIKSASSLLRCPEEAFAEAKLLRGMYFLKQAQLQDVSAYSLESQTRWRSVLRQAETEFRNGLDLLQEATGRNRAAWFDDLQAEVSLASRLEQGLSIIQRCTREIDLGPDDPAWQDMDAFFGHYGVMKCS